METLFLRILLSFLQFGRYLSRKKVEFGDDRPSYIQKLEVLGVHTPQFFGGLVAKFPRIWKDPTIKKSSLGQGPAALLIHSIDFLEAREGDIICNGPRHSRIRREVIGKLNCRSHSFPFPHLGTRQSRRYGRKDMSVDFPLRNCQNWKALLVRLSTLWVEGVGAGSGGGVVGIDRQAGGAEGGPALLSCRGTGHT